MKNQLTFAHVTGALLDNKIKTYPQHRLVRDLFSLCLLDEASDYGEASDDNVGFSNFSPTWQKVKSVLAPCLFIASSFIL